MIYEKLQPLVGNPIYLDYGRDRDGPIKRNQMKAAREVILAIRAISDGYNLVHSAIKKAHERIADEKTELKVWFMSKRDKT